MKLSCMILLSMVSATAQTKVSATSNVASLRKATSSLFGVRRSKLAKLARDSRFKEMKQMTTTGALYIASRLLLLFRSKSIPAHREIGMKILGPFLSIEDPDTFFFMRGFPDLPSRKPMKAKFYEGELWKRGLENVLLPMLDKYDVVLVEDPEDQVRW